MKGKAVHTPHFHTAFEGFMAREECEFYLMKYVPDPVRNEFVHVGVVVRAISPLRPKGTAGKLALKFTTDWKRVRCLDPEADTGMLEGLESELRRRFVEEPEGNLWHVLEDSFSNCVQMTEAKGYLAESLEAGVEELMRMYVEPMRRERVSRISGRVALQARMRSEFELAGVWDLMRKRVAAAQYTRPGDPLRIDCGYRNGILKLFQAVSLDAAGAGSGVEAAKGLAFSAAALRAGVERVEKMPLELTAIVEPWREVQGPRDRGIRDQGRQGSGVRGQRSGDGEEQAEGGEEYEAYRFAVETMEEHQIRVLTTADLGRVAETVRRELRM